MSDATGNWSEELKINKIGIVGVGLLGGSIGLAVKSMAPDVEVLGIGRREETLEKALKLKAIDRFTLDMNHGVAGCDLVVICTPIHTIAPIFASIRPFLKPGALVTDVGSTKEMLVSKIECEPGGRDHFVGSHPMAGSEQSGVEAAVESLYRRATIVITRTDATSDSSIQRLKAFWSALGGTVEIMTPADHDNMVAYTSHLPHAVSSCLSHSLDQRFKPGDLRARVYGNGLLDTTRISEGDPAIWVDILTSNRENVLESIAKFRESLDFLEHSLKGERDDNLSNCLNIGKLFRSGLKSSPVDGDNFE